ncbi:hypothetical protein Nepgr_003448 [Nepenthes gracilis]|uniref:Uncharacterized protein n=1 Tax=Nepenthes gracilis TaxID=150966 RepID=A0AAD3RZM2_NEPGR|nr:hypothetical protein Nepgr_003448 [Nepenthes gracilis]
MAAYSRKINQQVQLQLHQFTQLRVLSSVQQRHVHCNQAMLQLIPGSEMSNRSTKQLHQQHINKSAAFVQQQSLTCI